MVLSGQIVSVRRSASASSAARGKDTLVANWFDRFSGPDLLVGMASETKAVLEQKLGIPAGQPLGMASHGVGFDISYLQVNEDHALGA